MTTPVDICNRALSHLGASSITSMDEESSRGDLCRLHYDPARQEVISTGYFAFAVRQDWLTVQVFPPPERGDFSVMLQLPEDALTVLRVHTLSDWMQSGRTLLTNSVGETADLTIDVEDASVFTPLFSNVLSYSLAASMCVAVTENLELQMTLRREYITQLAPAAGNDTAYRQRADRRVSRMRLARAGSKGR